jgi:hypothetical protein
LPALGLGLLVATLAPSALAAPTAQQRALAEQLFRDARKLVKSGDIDEACPKFAESQRLDPQLGTLLHLATCHEKQGLTASAWVEYTEATALAKRAGESDREAIARARADKLEQRLSRLSIEAAERPPGFEVLLDGKRLGDAAIGTAVPVDPGAHDIEARAPGRVPWRGEVVIDEGPSEQSFAIPALEEGAAPDDPGPKVIDERPDEAQEDGTVMLISGIAVGGVGIAGLVVGTVFGLSAVSKSDEADTFCEGKFCEPQGLDLHTEADDAALISTISFVAGGALVVTGVVLIALAPSGSDSGDAGDTDGASGFWVAPSFDPSGGMVHAGMRW